MKLENYNSIDSARTFYKGLRELGYDFFTGVPCSLLGQLYTVMEEAATGYYPATREDLALGLAAGATLSGKRPVVLMQNSGLGVAINALISLHQMYELRVLIIISWRGYRADAPEHVKMGSSMVSLLDLLDIRHRFALDEHALDQAFHHISGPIALLVRPGEFGS